MPEVDFGDLVELAETPAAGDQLLIRDVSAAVGSRDKRITVANLAVAGPPGADGQDGAPGADGADGAPGADGADGADGLSAYEVAVAEGFVGDETAWLASLVGADGADGADGAPGADGADGAPGADGSDADVTMANVVAALFPLNTVAASGATETLVMGVNDVTMDEACEFTFPTVGAGRHEFTLILRGAFTPTFPASVDWPSATPPTYASPTEFSFATVDSGTTWLGVAAPGFG
jgi:hypothetical protein